MKKKFKIRLKNLSIQVAALLVIIILLTLSFFQLSSVQTYLGRLLANDLTDKTGFGITINKVDIVWLDQIKLEAIEIKDLSSNKMISVGNLMMNYKVSSLTDDNQIVLDKIILHQPNVNLLLDDSVSLNITEFINRIKKAYLTKKSKKPKPFIIRNVEINDGVFTYNHLGKDSIPDRFDYNHFGFDALNASASNLIVVADTIALSIQQLTSTERSTQLPIHSLTTDYQLSKSQMKLQKLKMVIGNSVIGDSIIFNYDKVTDLNQFVEKVLINAHFEELKLSTQDLKYFAPYFKDINDTILFTGNISGQVNGFTANKFSAQFGQNSNLKGKTYIQGLPDVYNTFIDLKVSSSNIYKGDLAPYIKSKSFQKYYTIESAKLNGSFTGYPKDFVAKAKFDTELGFFQTDINLKIDNDPSKSKYSGSIKLVEFDLGGLADSTSIVGKTSLNGNIKGVGFTLNSADFVLKSKINKIHINNYDYTNIATNAHFTEGLFDGSFQVKDPNLDFNATGIIDLRDNKNQIEIKGELIKAQLEALQLREDKSDIAAKFDISLKGIELDSIVGKIDISNLVAHNLDELYNLDHLEIISEINENDRALVVFSERVDLVIKGDFNFSTAFTDIKNIWRENKVNFLNQENDIQAFYKTVELPSSTTNLSFDAKLYNANPLINLFEPSLYASSNSRIQGKLDTSKDKEFELTFTNDTLIYNNNTLLNNQINISSKSKFNAQDHDVKFNFNSKRQILRSNSILDSLLIKARWKNDSLNFNFHVQQGLDQNINNINGLMLFKTDTTVLSVISSNIKILDQSWHFDKSNKITFSKDQAQLSNLSIISKDQELFASGTISKTNNLPISIVATNIKMENFNPLIKNKLEGALNGSAQISNIFDIPLLESTITIDSFKVDGFNFGNIVGKSNWNQPKELFDINFYVERDRSKLINVLGTYKPLGDETALNLSAELINTDLKLVEPFTRGLFRDMSGSVSGNIFITGALFEPKLVGSGKINDASLTIDYLNAILNAQGEWRMDSTQIDLSNIKITDNEIGTGALNASFTHNNYKDFKMNLTGSFNNLITLNTLSKDNNYFYGKTIGTGNISIVGPFSNLTISTQAKTEKGTKFYVPLTKSKGGVKQADFISFTNFTQEVNDIITPIKEELKLRNLAVNLDIEITPDAYAEIIFDLTAGDIIRGRGNGNLSLTVDSKGEFTVLGDYEFTEGAYNFTMYNIVNKEFKISPKSKISWSGDPYLGKMDIDAIYEVNTSLAAISTDTIFQNLPEANRIYPSKVLLDLEGLLLSPNINFDIVIEDYPKSNVDIDTEVRAFLNKIHNDEQELNRQVFSLLVFRSYSPPNSFSTGGTVGSSVSEFVSNQLSYWISQVDENLTIDFDLGELDENALETFQLRVSYAFMDGKLIVTRDGGFTDQNQETTLSSITGDWTVEYLLSKDGKLRVKLFKRTNYDQLSSSTGTNDELVSGGFSLLYTDSFDSFKELFQRNKNRQSPNADNEVKPKEALKPEEEENTP